MIDCSLFFFDGNKEPLSIPLLPQARPRASDNTQLFEVGGGCLGAVFPLSVYSVASY